jgi:hypothetical protein
VHPSVLTSGALAVCLCLLACAPVGAAHHAVRPQYDPEKPVVLRGAIVRMQWANPHGWISLDVRGAKGEVVTWTIETGAPNELLRRGWRRVDLGPGVELVIRGILARDGRPTVSATDITFADGRPLVAGSAPVSPPDESGLRRRWQ